MPVSSSSFEVEKTQIIPLLRQKEYNKALELLEQVQTADPVQRQELLEMQAMCCFRLGLLERAAVCYHQLNEDHPQLAKPLVNLGAVYNRLRQYDQAIHWLRKAIHRDKANADAYYNLGFAQKHSGQSDLAISAYKEALKLNPKLEQAHLNLANLYLDRHNITMAIQHYRTALTLNPELQVAQRGLQRAYELDNKSQLQLNPFGRLVDVTQLAHQKSATAIRTLSEAERRKDREEVLQLSKNIRNAARHMAEDLRERLQPSLLALTRSLVGGEHRPDLIFQNHERYQQELARFHEKTRLLKRSILELRGHEEFLNTPELDF